MLYTHKDGVSKTINLTCYVVHGVESDAKFANFKRVLGLHALLHVLNALPIFLGEHGIVVGQQSRALELVEAVRDHCRCSMLPAVQVEVDFACARIVRILNDLLQSQSSERVIITG